VNRINERWWTSLRINGEKVKVQLDTASPKCVISKRTVRAINCREESIPTKKKFVSYTGHRIPVIGKLKLEVESKLKKGLVTFYIVNNAQMPLISGDVAEKLDLIKRINKCSPEQLASIDPESTKTTVMLPGLYKIKIDPTATSTVNGLGKYPI
jgi:hypothetical protein